MFSATKHHDKKRLSCGGGEQSLIFLLLIFLQVPFAWAQSANIGFSSSYVCAGQDISFTVSLHYEGSDPMHVDIYSAVGQLACTEIGPGNHDLPFYREATYDISGDNFWVEVWFDDVKAEENFVPIIRITSFDAFANGQSTWAVAVGQRADFKISLNNYMGNGPDWAPAELWFENVDNQNGSWASKTWGNNGYEYVAAFGISPDQYFYIYVVHARIKSVTFTGADFAAVNKDSDGTPYAEPHYDSANPEYRPPVQLRRGSRPTMNLAFEVLPPEYPGSLYVKALTGLETPVCHALVCAGIAQYPNVQTSQALPDSVGYDPDLTLTWEYSVAGDEFYPAGDSTHKIYRTLNAPTARYHTSVDVACKNILGSDEDTVTTNIWNKFVGKRIQTFDGVPITYWGGYNPPSTVAGLVAERDGRCIAWSRFFVDCLDVHAIQSQSWGIFKPTTVFGFWWQTSPPEWLNNGTCLSIRIDQNLPGQNNDNPPYIFSDGHAVVLKGDVLYDPSYGISYRGNNLIRQWEDANVQLYGVLTWWVIDIKTFQQCTDGPLP